MKRKYQDEDHDVKTPQEVGCCIRQYHSMKQTRFTYEARSWVEYQYLLALFEEVGNVRRPSVAPKYNNIK